MCSSDLVGPALAGYGVSSPLADPVLTITNGAGNEIAANDNWENAANLNALRSATSLVGAFAFGAGSRDAALLITLAPGSYTVQVAGVAGATGTALLEIHELP